MPERRRNGFHGPFPILQLCTWVYLPVLMLQFLFFVSPILPLAASIPCSLLFFALALACAYFTYMACITDPIDVHLQQHLCDTQGESFPKTDSGCLSCFSKGDSPPSTTETTPPDEEETKYCWVCETTVAHHSMHCKYCNKCVSHFDHHCLWLNTCVGHANYGYFYKILWSTCCMLVVHTSCMVGIVIDAFLDGSTKTRANEWFNANAWGAVVGVNLVFILTNMISLSAVAQLLHFHIGLQKKNLTTYQFIVSDNARRRQAFQQKEERKSQRTAAVARARHEGNGILATRLQLGQYCCAACDALPASMEEGDAAAAPTAATMDVSASNGGGAGKHEQQTAGYAELSDSGDEPEDEKTSMASDQDLVLVNATSLGGSSSSQFGSKEAIIKPSTSSDNVTAENSNEEEPVGDDDRDQEQANVIASPSNDVQEGATSTNGIQEGATSNHVQEEVAVETSNGEDGHAGVTNFEEEPKPSAVEPEKEQPSTENI